MPARVYLLALLSVALCVLVEGHGRLTIPAPRECADGKCSIDDGDAPINFNADDAPESQRWPANDPTKHPEKQSLVCRIGNQDQTAAVLQVSAGTSLSVKWAFTAAHPGDGGLFVSYDYNLANRQEMKWFKIANFPQQRRNNKQLLSVKLPAWLPKGRAVIRWDWYATHNAPYVEFYSNCIDVEVASVSTTLPSAIPSYKLEVGTNGAGSYPTDNYCWDCNAEDWNKKKIAGPACVGGVDGNCCDLSKYSPVGYAAGSGGGFTTCMDKGTSGAAPWLVAPTNAPVAPTNAPVAPTNAPVAPTNAPVSPTNTAMSPTNTATSPTNTATTPTNAARPTNAASPTAVATPTAVASPTVGSPSNGAVRADPFKLAFAVAAVFLAVAH